MSKPLTNENLALVKSCLEKLSILYEYNTNSNNCDIIATTMADLIISGLPMLSLAACMVCGGEPVTNQDGTNYLITVEEQKLLSALRLSITSEENKLTPTPLLLQIYNSMEKLTNYENKKTDIPMWLSIGLTESGEKDYWERTVCPLSSMVGRLCIDLVALQKILELDSLTVPTFLASILTTEIGIPIQEISIYGKEPVDAGDVPSKTHRGILSRLGMVTPVVYKGEQGYHALTYLGDSVVGIMGLMKQNHVC